MIAFRGGNLIPDQLQGNRSFAVTRSLHCVHIFSDILPLSDDSYKKKSAPVIDEDF